MARISVCRIHRRIVLRLGLHRPGDFGPVDGLALRIDQRGTGPALRIATERLAELVGAGWFDGARDATRVADRETRSARTLIPACADDDSAPRRPRAWASMPIMFLRARPAVLATPDHRSYRSGRFQENEMTPHRFAIAGLLTLCTVAGCATQDVSPNVPSYVSPPTGTGPAVTRGEVVEPRYARDIGVVSSIELIRGESSRGVSPAGTIIGAVVGGVLGNQIGEGRGRTAATVVGAAGGALAGNEIGQRTESSADTYRIAIRYDGGGLQYIDVANPGDLRTGDRVRVDGGQISRY